MLNERIQSELALLYEGGQVAELLHESTPPVVLYKAVPTGGERLGLPSTTDVVVPVPSGHPAALIDLAGLPADSPFLSKVRGGQNSQGRIVAAGRDWQLASYHPHNGGGGPPFDPIKHGFHTYLDHLIAWLDKLG